MRAAAKILEDFCEGYDGDITFYPDYSGRGCMAAPAPA